MPIDNSEALALAGKLKSVQSDINKQSSTVLRKAAKAVERGAKSRAPVDTGTLQGDIYSAVRGKVAQIIAPTRYAQFNEYGTSRMAPQPFMTPALEAEGPKFLTALEESGDGVLRRAVGG